MALVSVITFALQIYDCGIEDEGLYTQFRNRIKRRPTYSYVLKNSLNVMKCCSNFDPKIRKLSTEISVRSLKGFRSLVRPSHTTYY